MSSFCKTGLFSGLSAFWRGLPWAQKTGIIVLCTLVLGGHLVDRNRKLFPFVRWNMYASRYEPTRMEAFEIYAVTQAGDRVHINIARTLPPIRRGAAKQFTRRVKQLEQRARAPDAFVVDQVASSVASLYSELNGTTLASVEVVKEIIYQDAPGSYRRAAYVFRTVPLRRTRSPVAYGAALSP